MTEAHVILCGFLLFSQRTNIFVISPSTTPIKLVFYVFIVIHCRKSRIGAILYVIVNT